MCGCSGRQHCIKPSGGGYRAVRTPSRLDQDLKLTLLLQPANPTIYLRVVGSKNFPRNNCFGTEFGYRTLVAKKLYVDLAVFQNAYDDLYGYGQGSIFCREHARAATRGFSTTAGECLKGRHNGV